MKKEVVLLVLFDAEGRLCMKLNTHPTEGYEVLDFAISSERIDQSQDIDEVAARLAKQIGVSGEHVYAGTFTEHITKMMSPGGEKISVSVCGYVYRVEGARAADFNNDDVVWKTKDRLAVDQRARRDRWLHPYLFSSRAFSVEADTDQTKSWIDAVTVKRSS